jgi:hypothetical protein
MRKGWSTEMLDKAMADIMLRDLTAGVNTADTIPVEDIEDVA